MAQLIGAFVGTFLISRLFWLAARAWPNSIEKAIFLNVICMAFIVPLDFIVRGDVSLTQEFIIYGGCQLIVLIYDTFRVRRDLVAPSKPDGA
jgi:hypothetical protein